MRRRLFSTSCGLVLVFVGCAVGNHRSSSDGTSNSASNSSPPALVGPAPRPAGLPPEVAPGVAGQFAADVAAFDAALQIGVTTDRTTSQVVGDQSSPDYRVRAMMKAAAMGPAVLPTPNFNVVTGAPVHATPSAFSYWTASSPNDVVAFGVDGTSAGRGIASTQVTAGWEAGAADSALLVLANLYQGTKPDLLAYASTTNLPLTESFGLSAILMNLAGTSVYGMSKTGKLYCFHVTPRGGDSGTGAAMATCSGSWPYNAGSGVTWSSPYPTYKGNELKNIYFGDDTGHLHCVQGLGNTSPGSLCTGWGSAVTLIDPADSVPVGPPSVNVDTTTALETVFVGDDKGRLFRITNSNTGTPSADTSAVEVKAVCTTGGTCATNPWAIRGAPAIDFTDNLVYVPSAGYLTEWPMTKEQNGGVWQQNNLAKTLYASTNAQIEGSVTLGYSSYAYIGFHNTLYKVKYPFDGNASTTIYSTLLAEQVASSDNYPRGYPLPYYNSIYMGTGANTTSTGVVEAYGCTTSALAPVLTGITSATAGPPYGEIVETGMVLSYQSSGLYFGYDTGSSGGLVQYPAGSPDPSAAWACPAGDTTSSTLACGSPGCNTASTCTGSDAGVCTKGTNVATETCSSGSCAVATCNAGFADCDGNNANGCEVNTQTDTANCGFCGTVCSSVGETPSCSGGLCGTTCNAGFAQCTLHADAGAGCPTAVTCASCCGAACGGQSSCIGSAAGGAACTAATSQTVCATVSEHSTATVTCPTADGVIEAISFISYGSPNGSCGSFTAGTCDDTGATAGNNNERKIAADLCYGKNSCSILAENATTQDGTTFGDPCSGTFKRLYLQVQCTCPPGASECANGYEDGLETDIDCGGGTCAKCVDTKKCTTGTDCFSGTCTSGVCAAPTTCSVGGGSPPCSDGSTCGAAADCFSAVCTSGSCASPTTCTVGGGAPPCQDGSKCGATTDCESQVCTSGICGTPTLCTVGGGAAPCRDGSDCGAAADCQSGTCNTATGVCVAPTTCTVGGGASPCQDGSKCGATTDCESGVCTSALCAAPTSCTVGGGASPCQDGSKCGAAADCESGICTSGLCVAPTCASTATKCAVGATCGSGADCGSGTCTGGVCVVSGTGGACILDADCTSTDCQCGTNSGSCTGGGVCGAKKQVYTTTTAGTFSVPASCTTVYVEAWGAGGGGGGRSSAEEVGGGGGFGGGELAVTASTGTITINVGGGGVSSTAAAAGGTSGTANTGGGGRGDGTRSAGGGGAGTFVTVTTGSTTHSMTVGGGGGAAARAPGGPGGGTNATAGSSNVPASCTGGGGATGSTPGVAGTGTGTNSHDGAVGTTIAGGSGYVGAADGAGGGGGGSAGGGGGGVRTTGNCTGGGGGGATAFVSVANSVTVGGTTSSAGNDGLHDYTTFCGGTAGNAGTTTGTAGQAGCVVIRCE